MAVLMAVCAAMMGAFLGYHLWLLRAGMTTSETYKWRDLRLVLGEQQYGTDRDDVADAGNGGDGGDERHHTGDAGNGYTGVCPCASVAWQPSCLSLVETVLSTAMPLCCLRSSCMAWSVCPSVTAAQSTVR